MQEYLTLNGMPALVVCFEPMESIAIFCSPRRVLRLSLHMRHNCFPIIITFLAEYYLFRVITIYRVLRST